MNTSSRQRRERILTELFERRHVLARDLALRIGVSEATIRRDLRGLAADGQVDLVYGGATLRRASDFSFHAKATRNMEAKRAIGRLAAGVVQDQDHIFLDSGTTCFEMAAFLDAPGLSVIMLGGQYRPDRMDFVGPLALSILNQLRGYVCFIGADGLHMDFGPTAADIESASLYRQAALNGRQTVLLVDHSKFTAASLFKIVDWEQISMVVTDRAPDGSWEEFFRSRGIGVVWEKE
jgi:DeoR family fructose operon transcriptional repressor